MSGRLSALVLCALLVGCGGGQRERRDTGTTTSTASGLAPVHEAQDTFVSVGGGRRLHLVCQGSGRPAIVLEAGFPGTSEVWQSVAPRLGGMTRTCAYDRAGLGASTPIAGVHEPQDEVDDLQRLVAAAHLPAPYVLVGHSYGGLLVRAFATEHPAATAGLVLVDAVGPDQERRQRALWPASVRPSLRRAVYRPVQHGMHFARMDALGRRVRTLGRLPLVVVTAGTHAAEWGRVLPPPVARALDRLWVQMQDELAALSSDHVHVVAVRSGHFVQRFDGRPDVVIDAVAAVVRAARTHARLAACADCSPARACAAAGSAGRPTTISQPSCTTKTSAPRRGRPGPGSTADRPRDAAAPGSAPRTSLLRAAASAGEQRAHVRR